MTDTEGELTYTDATVPYLPSDTYQILAHGQSSNAGAVAFFTSADFIRVSPSTYYLLPGEVLTFSGNDFAPNETVQLFEGENTTVLAEISTDAMGSFTNSGNITIPLAGSGATALFGLPANTMTQPRLRLRLVNFIPWSRLHRTISHRAKT